jgi:hypothetical protein
MELEISRYLGQKQNSESQTYQILEYRTIVEKTDLILVKNGTMDLDEKKEKVRGDFLQLYKIQYILSCDIEIAKGVLVAFYIGDGAELLPFVMDGLPMNHSQDVERMTVLDYKSYSEFCEYTKETKLSIFQYIKEMNGGNLGPNSFFTYKNQALNYDEQKKLWQTFDKE